MSNNVFWGAAAISIAAASWVLYHFLAPKSWREWTSAGLMQAFVIAFYAEMYGFPVTIYLFTRIFGVDISGNLWDGNLWVYLFGTPGAMLISMIAGYTIAFAGIILISVSWRELYRAHREGRLANRGPYAFIRHPQYTGIFLAVFGEGVVHWPTVFSLAAFPLIVVVYVLLAYREERQMLRSFGAAYKDYQEHVPMFFPRWGNWHALFDQPGR